MLGRVRRSPLQLVAMRSSPVVRKVYAYIPRPNNVCGDSGIQCNDQYGISIDRDSFSFSSGQHVDYFPLYLRY